MMESFKIRVHTTRIVDEVSSHIPQAPSAELAMGRFF